MFVRISEVMKRSAKVVTTALVVTSLAGVGLAAPKNKKTETAPTAAKIPDRIGVDISKLFWPQPPAIARLKYLDMYTGQKIDWTKVKKLEQEANAKPKLTWRDKLAGTDPLKSQHIDFKMPFQLMHPTGITFDSKGRIYIADSKVGAIFVYNPEDKSTTFIANGQQAHFGLMIGMATDDDDRIFVTDAKLRRVIVLNKGKEEDQFGSDVMVSPAGIAIDRENRLLYVVDTQLDQVLVYDADTYKLLRRIGTTGKKHTLTDPGDFSLPTHCAVDSDGNLYVTDTLNNRVEIFDADGNFIREFGKAGDGPGYFGRPKGIAIDPDGHVWVADALLQRVQVFDKRGRLLMWLGQPGELPGMFSALDDIAIDSNDRVVTTEEFPARAQIFRYVTDKEAAAESKRREQEREQRSAEKRESAMKPTPATEGKPDVKDKPKPDMSTGKN